MIQLEKYRGMRTKHDCPSCGGRRCFVRYVGEDNRYLANDVGKCDRHSNCGFHRTPKQFFFENPPPRENASVGTRTRKPKPIYALNVSGGSQPIPVLKQTDSRPHYIPFELFKQTLGGYERNAFVNFLLKTFPDCAEEIQNILKMYFVGSLQDYTCFPYIDGFNRICKGKLIKYNSESGRRLKGEFDTSSLVSKLRSQGKITGDFNYAQIFFGEHLLKQFPNKTIAIVEAEKSAIIGSLCMPEFIWLGSHSKTWLKPERLAKLGNRKIILYPDADGYAEWQLAAQEARKLGVNVRTSSLIETCATNEQKAKGYDLADFLINQQNEINEQNKWIDFENEKLEAVKNNLELNNQFNSILDERKAILMEDGLSETDAETVCTQAHNIRNVVHSLFKKRNSETVLNPL